MIKFDVIVIGGGLAGMTAATAIQQAGLSCAVIRAGLSLSNPSCDDFVKAGGRIIFDKVCDGVFDDSVLRGVHTGKLGATLLEAREFVLATGKFFSMGLAADMDRVYETVFGLDTEYEEDRSKWFGASFSAEQPFLGFGVKTQDGLALKGGEPVKNLRPAGEILAGISNAGGDASETIRNSALDAAKSIIELCRK